MDTGSYVKVKSYLDKLVLPDKNIQEINHFIDEIELLKKDLNTQKIEQIHHLNTKIKEILANADVKSLRQNIIAVENKKRKLRLSNDYSSLDELEALEFDKCAPDEQYDVFMKRFENVLHSFVFDVEVNIDDKDYTEDDNDSSLGYIKASEVYHLANICLSKINKTTISDIIMSCILQGNYLNKKTQNDVFDFLTELKRLRCFVDVLKRRKLFSDIKTLGTIDDSFDYERKYDLDLPTKKVGDECFNDKQVLRFIEERLHNLSSITDASQASIRIIDEACVLMEGMSILSYPAM